MEVQTDHLRRELAYIRGLLEGAGEGAEKKALNKLVDLMDELAEENGDLRLRQTELEEYVEAVDEDLNELELRVYDEDGEADGDEEWDGEDIGYWGVECPQCGESVLVEEETLNDPSVARVVCPECDTTLLLNREEEKKKEESHLPQRWEAPESRSEDGSRETASRH